MSEEEKKKEKNDHVKNEKITKKFLNNRENEENTTNNLQAHLFNQLIEEENIIELEKLLSTNYFDISSKEITEKEALHKATAKGNIHLIKLLLQHNFDINSTNNKGQTIFHIAIQKNDLKITKYLAENTPINIFTSIKTIGEATVEKNYKNKWKNWTALHFSIDIGNLDLFYYLLSIGYEKWISDQIKNVSNYGNEIQNGNLAIIAAEKGRIEILKYLLEVRKDFDKNMKDNYGFNLLFFAVEKGEIKTVKYLINIGVEFTQKGVGGISLLIYSALNSQILLFSYFLSIGFNLYLTMDDQSNSLHISSRNGLLNMVKYLIKIGFDVDRFNDRFQTPLMEAILFDQFSIVKILIRKGKSNLDLLSSNNRNLLYLAARWNRLDIFKYLFIEYLEWNSKNDQNLSWKKKFVNMIDQHPSHLDIRVRGFTILEMVNKLIDQRNGNSNLFLMKNFLSSLPF